MHSEVSEIQIKMMEMNFEGMGKWKYHENGTLKEDIN